MRSKQLFRFLAPAVAAATLSALPGCYAPLPPPPPPAVAVPIPPPATYYTPGYVVPAVPAGYAVRTYSGVPYYHYRGVYYKPHPRGYVVVGRPVWW